ncbi:hypothetical protein DL762_003164 [Monosporascus cannonballus]|uniref:Zn(2)-C6 fungal-type domain-containing protein n=1 Tax=Monosporascus cannonballus TaxID=155416 RepID=A0ABY0HBD6_9PEZI|nr:hypothetical protein DL762_003164 [Monosporascus cannonballus]
MPSSQNNNNLMGFSVHQPSVGAALQFFPPMGSKELDQMIDAYVPGNASILDKRTVVTCEFVQHSIATGELFKFFLVYPYSSSDSFDSPISLQDSGYGSVNTSPVMSDGQWGNAASSSSSKSRSPPRKATASDFSHMPGMKIMTKDGVDVTNSASRGCKTKEQRDHAHLMRIIKACESCRKKKVRCDPSHKKRSSSQSQSPEPKSHKKVKKASIAPKVAAPQMCVSDQTAVSPSASFAGSHNPPPEINDTPEWMSSFDSLVPTDEIDIFSEMESWDQFINYSDESTAVQQDYSFNVDRFSPTTSSTNSTSLSQPLTPATGRLSSDGFEFTSADSFIFDSGVAYAGAFASGEIAPTLPYLNPGGIEGGTNYLDFNLYSPGSTSDEDLGFSKEVAAASPQQESFDRLGGDQSDGPYEHATDRRHTSEFNACQPNAGRSRESARQSSAAGDRQASLFSGQEMMPAPCSLHGQSRSSLLSPADSTRRTGLAGVDNQRVPAGNGPYPPVIPPRDPNIPRRPHEEAAIDSGAMHRASIEESQATQSSRSRTISQASPQGSGTSGHASLTPDTRKTMSGETSVSSAVDPTDHSTHARERHLPSTGLRSNSLPTSATLPEQGILVSSQRNTSGRSSSRADSPCISHSTSAEATSLSLMAGTYRTKSSAEQGALLQTSVANSGLSSADALSQPRDDAAGTSLMTTTGLYESKQRSLPGGEEAPSIVPHLDGAEIAVFVCLAALALFSKTAAPLTVGTMFVIAAFVGLWRQSSCCADKLDLSAQPLSFAEQFIVRSTGVGSWACDALQRFSRARCAMRKSVFSRSSARRGRSSWTGPEASSRAYNSGTYIMG